MEKMVKRQAAYGKKYQYAPIGILQHPMKSLIGPAALQSRYKNGALFILYTVWISFCTVHL
jgi:hypothetical protein